MEGRPLLGRKGISFCLQKLLIVANTFSLSQICYFCALERGIVHGIGVDYLSPLRIRIPKWRFCCYNFFCGIKIVHGEKVVMLNLMNRRVSLLGKLQT